VRDRLHLKAGFFMSHRLIHVFTVQGGSKGPPGAQGPDLLRSRPAGEQPDSSHVLDLKISKSHNSGDIVQVSVCYEDCPPWPHMPVSSRLPCVGQTVFCWCGVQCHRVFVLGELPSPTLHYCHPACSKKFVTRTSSRGEFRPLCQPPIMSVHYFSSSGQLPATVS